MNELDTTGMRMLDERDRQTLEQAVTRALDLAADGAATAAAVDASLGLGLSVEVRMGELETVEHHRDRTLGVTVWLGERSGSAATTDLAEVAIGETVRAALEIARHTEPDPCAGLPERERLAWDPPVLDLFHPWSIEPQEAAELALSCEAAALGADPRIRNSDGATLATGQSLHCLGNSHGLLVCSSATRHSLSCTPVAEDTSGMQRDFWYSLGRVPRELEAPETIGRRAAERALARLGGRRLGTLRVPVLFENRVAPSLFRHLIAALSGGALYRRSSFLLDSVGQQLFPQWLTLREEPHLPRALGSAAFDAEGVATRPSDLVAAGVLQRYCLDSYSARKLGLETTGNAGGVHNLVVTPGEQDLQGLLRQMGTGLLVTELMGFGVDTVSGDYSRGAAGFWVEGGEIAHPVEEITIAGNLRQMYSGILAIGSDIETRGSIRSGSVLIDAMTVAGE